MGFAKNFSFELLELKIELSPTIGQSEGGSNMLVESLN